MSQKRLRVGIIFGGRSGEHEVSVMSAQGILEAKGMEVLVLNLTRPDIGIPVVKVVVPGLRSFWARFAPGRLYDVPIKLGWLDQAMPESKLNPLHPKT